MWCLGVPCHAQHHFSCGHFEVHVQTTFTEVETLQSIELTQTPPIPNQSTSSPELIPPANSPWERLSRLGGTLMINPFKRAVPLRRAPLTSNKREGVFFTLIQKQPNRPHSDMIKTDVESFCHCSSRTDKEISFQEGKRIKICSLFLVINT